MRGSLVLLGCLALAGAAGCSTGIKALNAGLNTGIAVGVAAHERSEGRCYTWHRVGFAATVQDAVRR